MCSSLLTLFGLAGWIVAAWLYILLRQSVEQTDEALSQIRELKENGQVAQLGEQRTENPRVGGSIPPLTTNGM
jgi:hypothetical protein